MDKKDIERRLEAAEKQNLGLLDEIKNLKAQLADMQDEPEIPDMPYFDGNEKYWFIYNDLSTTDANMRFCGGSTKCFNAFHTKEMAQEFADKCKLIAMMLHCKWYVDRDGVCDFGKFGGKWTVWYNHSYKQFEAYSLEDHEAASVYFSTKESARKCADWFNEHWRKNDEESV